MRWTDAFETLVAEKISGLDETKIRENWAWVERVANAGAMLTPENLRAMPATDIYDRLREISFNGVPIRLTNLGRVNDSERIVEAIITLLTTAGDFSTRYRAAKIPQAGLVTITEILCAARPNRFVCRSAEFTRALVKAAPLYGFAALKELPYEEFLDLCRVLCETQEKSPSNTVRDFSKKFRYLWLYAVLVA